MNRIQQTFQRAKEQGRACFVSYVCAGDPDFDTSLEVCRTLVNGGTDILELGVPFSDPLADGLTNQLAAERALYSGMDQVKVLKLVATLRQEFPDLPIVLYTYYNLIFSKGTEASVKSAADAGVDAFLTLDLPPEEADDMVDLCAQYHMQTVFIIAPTSPEDRIARICEKATGFLYYVSREGVTGERDDVAGDLADKLRLIKAYASLPVVVGFGISRPEHVQSIGKIADGVVVGSALVNFIASHPGDPEAIIRAVDAKIHSLAGALS